MAVCLSRLRKAEDNFARTSKKDASYYMQSALLYIVSTHVNQIIQDDKNLHRSANNGNIQGG